MYEVVDGRAREDSRSKKWSETCRVRACVTQPHQFLEIPGIFDTGTATVIFRGSPFSLPIAQPRRGAHTYSQQGDQILSSNCRGRTSRGIQDAQASRTNHIISGASRGEERAERRFEIEREIRQITRTNKDGTNDRLLIHLQEKRMALLSEAIRIARRGVVEQGRCPWAGW